LVDEDGEDVYRITGGKGVKHLISLKKLEN
jgi:hypothetical protein